MDKKRADGIPKPPALRKKPADQSAVAGKFPRTGAAHVAAKDQEAPKPRPTDCGTLFWSWANPGD